MFKIDSPSDGICIAVQDAESNWQFDIFGYAEACHGKCLSMLTFHLMKQTGIIKEHGLDESKLCHFLQKIESGYDSANPYHNRYKLLPQWVLDPATTGVAGLGC